MPYMRIFQTEDKKWHTRDCLELIDNKYVRTERIGTDATIPDPSRDSFCQKCFGAKVTNK